MILAIHKIPSREPRQVFAQVTARDGYAYFYPVNEDGTPAFDAASYILVTASNDWERPGNGFGGSTLNLVLNNGDTFQLRGGWHTNADHLYVHTGVDIRNRYATRGVLATTFVKDPPLTLGGIFRNETEWIEGTYERVNDLAQALALTISYPVIYWKQTTGGDELSTKYPTIGASNVS